jgi:hypothetical protein
MIGVMNGHQLQQLFSDDEFLSQHFSQEKLKFFGGNGPGDCELWLIIPPPLIPPELWLIIPPPLPPEL